MDVTARDDGVLVPPPMIPCSAMDHDHRSGRRHRQYRANIPEPTHIPAMASSDNPELLTLVFGTGINRKYLPVHTSLVYVRSHLFRLLHTKADSNGRIENLPLNCYAQVESYTSHLKLNIPDLNAHIWAKVKDTFDIWDPESTPERQLTELVRSLSQLWLLGHAFGDPTLQNDAMMALLKQNVSEYSTEIQYLAVEVVDEEEMIGTELRGWYVHCIAATMTIEDLRGGSKWSKEFLQDLLGEVVTWHIKSVRRPPGLEDASAYLVTDGADEMRRDSKVTEDPRDSIVECWSVNAATSAETVTNHAWGVDEKSRDKSEPVDG